MSLLPRRTRRVPEKPPLPDQPAALTSVSKVPPLTRWERLGAAGIVLGGAGVGGLGFYASFDAVSTAAAHWGFTDPWVLPTAIDSAVPVFTGAYLLLIRLDMPLWWARLVPWVLSLVTCALNVASGDSLWAKFAHGSMSLLWAAVSEIAAHTYAVRIGAVTGRRKKLDKVRFSRWFLNPLPTFLLWRRMKLWEQQSYETVLRLEQQRLVYAAALHARYGRAWRRKAPVESLLPLRLARSGIPLEHTAAAGLAAADIDPDTLELLPALAPVAEVVMPEPEPEETKPAETPAALPARRPTAVIPPQAKAAPALPPQPSFQQKDAEETPGEDDLQEPMTENELYEVVVTALEAGEVDRFAPGGDLCGVGMGKLLQQSGGNGRKVRTRLLNRYAADLSSRGVDVPTKFTVEDLARLARPVTV
ncbi:uncharacterized protein DUF2637 [Streptomyces sp. BK022]|uniref:DUF2637 domain-containing protein n=1 Tax=Streptomyces sp. BK022 TaxID=2512123 RepID=UPI0010DB0D3F|nr:DUF2637 domain-containing protein [Streptomyces sp. BK022]RZU28186.1 uncharacterized protein DUF2637 [Streptomyces sp. BK022]